MTANEVLIELEKLGSPSIKKILINHGAKEPFFGVKVGDMKVIQKKTKKNHALALELYRTGNSDAMYLAGLIADEKAVTKDELQQWVKEAYWYMLSEFTVSWLAAESPFGWELGLEWIESEEESIATAGWATLSNWVALKSDNGLNIQHLSSLLDRVEKTIHSSKNREKHVMNGFIIAVGASVATLTEKCMEVGKNIGKVSVDMGKTACKVPDATIYIQKIIDMGRIGKKKKQARC